jgi:glycosyltransferase involved in cell wall biosynthesis
MIAYHFPPMAGSSGIQRTLRFAQQLPRYGWAPIVLTAQGRAYERTDDELLAELPPELVVRRAFALDSARHLTVGGRYLACTARPDRWVSWKFDAVRQGLQLIRTMRPSVIWSTYPIATAHLIGHALHRRTGLPWVADFRDPMAQEGYPADPATWQAYSRIEQMAMHDAASCVFTTPGAARVYRQRYPGAKARIDLIENGYDEESFSGIAQSSHSLTMPLTLLHSGIVYPSERDPTSLMQALALLRRDHALSPADLRVRFRAAVHDGLLRELAATSGVEDFIDIAPAIGYRDALTEMCSAGALLVLQASNCNEQIPAKLYEYLRAGRPVVGLTDPAGDTAAALRNAGVPYLAPLDDPAAIAALLVRLVAEARAGRLERVGPAAVAAASRQARTQALAVLLDAVAAAP